MAGFGQFGGYNPYATNGGYMSQLQQMMGQQAQPSMPRQDIIHVNGENGAKAYRMPPYSNALLLDDTAPIVWLAQTDGAGYSTLTPYTITPFQPAEPVDVGSLEDRIKKLEEIVNAKPHAEPAEPHHAAKSAGSK